MVAVELFIPDHSSDRSRYYCIYRLLVFENWTTLIQFKGLNRKITLCTDVTLGNDNIHHNFHHCDSKLKKSQMEMQA